MSNLVKKTLSNTILSEIKGINKAKILKVINIIYINRMIRKDHNI